MEGNENINQNPEVPKVYPERPTPPPAPVEEKKELLSREEVVTMAKDLSRAREKEALKEKERLLKLSSGPKEDKKIEEREEKRVKEALKNETLTPKDFKKPSSFQKIAVRMIAVLVLILAAGFIYWFFGIRLTEEPPEIVEQEEVIQEEIPESEPELVIVQNPADWGYEIPDEPRTIDTIVIFSVYNDVEEDYYNVESILATFKKNGAVPHYIISRTGEIFQLAQDEAIAYHSGNSQMPDGTRKREMNLYSLGIAMIYNENESPNELQFQQLKLLVSSLIEKYQIPIENIFTRQEISLSGSVTWNFDKEAFINSLNQ
ncbi:MAG: peptidoglycan recognition family protein [Candidatus Paceibacterota bacterium]|jgi:hypothetical protein